MRLKMGVKEIKVGDLWKIASKEICEKDLYHSLENYIKKSNIYLIENFDDFKELEYFF